MHVKTCTKMFVAAFFITAKTWKQPRLFGPSVGEWINKTVTHPDNRRFSFKDFINLYEGERERKWVREGAEGEADSPLSREPSVGLDLRTLRLWPEPKADALTNWATQVPPDNRIFLSPKKKWTIKPWKDMEETYIYIIKWKKPIWKGYVCYDSNYMTLLKMQNYRDRKEISSCQGLVRRKGWIGEAEKIYTAVKLSHIILLWWRIWNIYMRNIYIWKNIYEKVCIFYIYLLIHI